MSFRKTGAADGRITQAEISEVPAAEGEDALTRTAAGSQLPLWNTEDEQALSEEDKASGLE